MRFSTSVLQYPLCPQSLNVSELLAERALPIDALTKVDSYRTRVRRRSDIRPTEGLWQRHDQHRTKPSFCYVWE